MVARTLFEKPLALCRQLAVMACAAGALYGALVLAVANLPAMLGTGLAGPAMLYLALIALSVACVRGWQAVAHHRAVARFAREIGELEGQNRLLDFKSRMESRLVEVRSSAHLEREVNKRDRKIMELAHEGKLTQLKQQSSLEAIQRELDYYKREHQRMHQENRWLKSSLRQNHIDLAYLKEHVERFLTSSRPTLLARVRGLFTLSTPSPAIVKLARQLDDRGGPEQASDPSLVPAR